MNKILLDFCKMSFSGIVAIGIVCFCFTMLTAFYIVLRMKKKRTHSSNVQPMENNIAMIEL